MTAVNAKLALGQQQVQSGDYSAALQTFTAALNDEPNNLTASISLAHVLSYLGRYDEAKKALVSIIERAPKRLDVSITLGQLYAHLGQRNDAIACFRWVIEADPKNGDAWTGLTHLASSPGAAAVGATVAVGPLDATVRAYRERSRLVLQEHLLPLLGDGDRLVILDGGARDAAADPRWRAVPDERLQVYAFEPDTAECERLAHEARQAGKSVQFFPIGLWSCDGTLSFENNRTGGGSSFLRQNRAVTDRWKFENPQQATPAADIFYPLDQVPIAVTRLESWAGRHGIPNIDFVKLNVQGGEHEILRGAGPLVDGWLGMLVEVAFVESYQDRPMFSDIDGFLRDRGFTFFDLLAHHYVGRADAPVVAQHLRTASPALGQLVSSWGQLIEGHALYLRDPIAGAGPERPGSILKLICIAEIFGQVEYAFELLGWFANRCREKSDLALGDRLEAIYHEAHAAYLRFT